MKIVAYMLAAEECWSALGRSVNEAIAEGWVPFGGVAVAPDSEYSNAWMYVQALVQYEENEDPQGGDK